MINCGPKEGMIGCKTFRILLEVSSQKRLPSLQLPSLQPRVQGGQRRDSEVGGEERVPLQENQTRSYPAGPPPCLEQICMHEEEVVRPPLQKSPPSFPEILFRQPLTGLDHLPLPWSTSAASKRLEHVAGTHPPRSRPSAPCPGWPWPP